MIDKIVYIYGLINPLDNKVFYIGATVNPYTRLRQHICDMNYDGNYKQVVIDELICVHGIEPEMLILDTADLNTAAYWENFYIDLYRFYGFYIPQQKQKYKYNERKSKYFTTEVVEDIPLKIDGKDIHYYRREVLRNLSFYEIASHQQ